MTRRSSGVVPPHTPSAIPFSTAQARHWICTGQASWPVMGGSISRAPFRSLYVRVGLVRVNKHRPVRVISPLADRTSPAPG